MRAGGLIWWSGKVRRLRAHLGARIDNSERTSLAAWLSPAQIGIFDRMTIADQRHGLDVMAALRADGVTDHDALIAGLLHDAGKGDAGVLPRVAYSLGQAYGTWIPSLVGHLPGMAAPLVRLRAHPELSARMAEEAGCSSRTVELIRWQNDPRDPEYGEQLRLADEAN